MNKFIEIEKAAISGAYGSGKEPTEEQKLSGNYKKGRFDYFGIPVAIEQPRHSYRTGVDSDGKRWSSRMAAHYGYITGTKGADGGGVDVFVGYYPQSERVYVINQKGKSGGFDEHKVMLAFPDKESAIRAYEMSFDNSWGGLGVVVDCSIAQLKWWLKNADLSRPLFKENLPFEDFENMKRVNWADDESATPLGVTIERVLYDVRRNDDDGLLLDSVTGDEILEDSDGVLVLDALVVPFARLERQMGVMQRVMDRASGEVKPVSMQVTSPFRQHGTANVAVVFELSDGQTVSVFFHNPDVNPRSVKPQDELVSWKWLLNKKDITIVVAPERGQDINVRYVARRIMALAEKNSAAFKRANQRRAERMEKIGSLKSEIADLETQLKKAEGELELAKINAEERQAAAAQVAAQEPKRAVEPVTEPDPSVEIDPVVDPAPEPAPTANPFSVGDAVIWANANGEVSGQYRGPLDENTSVIMVNGMQMNAPTSELRLDDGGVNAEPVSVTAPQAAGGGATEIPPSQLSLDDLIDAISRQGRAERAAVKRWVELYGRDGAEALAGAGYEQRTVFRIIADKIKPNKPLMDAVSVDGDLSTYWDATSESVKALSRESFDALLESDPSESSGNERTREYAYIVLRYSDKKSEIEYIRALGAMKNHNRIASQSTGGKLNRMAMQYMGASREEKNAQNTAETTVTPQEAASDGELQPEGVENNVKTAKGTQVSTGFAVVEADTLIASHDISGNENPNYPQELQPRDRSRDASVAWVKKTAANLDPDSLGRTSRADSGAPIVGPDKVVESGNGRVMAIIEAYRSGQAGEYREWLTNEADFFGLSAEKIAAMRAPVLVRVRTADIDRATFAVEANQDDKLAMTATEKAKSDANRLDDHAISLMGESGDLTAGENLSFLQAFLRSLGDTESAQYITSDGKPTASLIARVQAAIFAKAYEDERLLELTADAARPEIANIINALNSAAPEFIKARAANPDAADHASSKITDGIELSLDEAAVQSVIGAINIVRDARDKGMDVGELVSQMGLFDQLDPNVAAMAVFISKNNRSARRLGVAFKAIADFIKTTAEHSQTVDMFGDSAPVSLTEVIDAANRALSREYGEGEFAIDNLGLFDQPAAEPEPTPEVEPEPAVEPVAEPVPMEQTNMQDPMGNSEESADKDFLKSIVDGSVDDILDPGLAEKLEQVLLRNEGNADIENLFVEAAAAYEQAMIRGTESIA